MILYFTGTGNSRYLAEKLSAALVEPLFSVNDALKQDSFEKIDTGKNVILVTPTYAWRIPRIVRDWVLRITLNGAQQIWFVMNCGDEIGNAAKYNRILAEKKGLSYMGTVQIVMPENYIAMFSAPTEQESQAIIEKAQPVLEGTAAKIRDGLAFDAPRNNLYDRIMSGPVNTIFYPFFVKAAAFQAGDACIGCGQCVRLCPLNNIHMEKQKPVWGNHCTHCMACICRCPREAIEYGKHSVGQRRYHLD